MPSRIEDYGLLSDLQTAALVSREGSVDWACFPRFDSGATFAGLLGTEEQGRWALAPVAASRPSRRYRGESLILETTWETDNGTARVIDFMPPRGEAPDIVRIVEGVSGEVSMRSELVIRFDYGSIVPWVRRIDSARVAVAGPDALCLRTPAPTHGENLRTISEFVVRAGERTPFTLTWFASHLPVPAAVDAERALADTEEYWASWLQTCAYDGEWREAVRRSLTVLKGLIYAPTGGIVAAPTTSLPERLGGVRNWDYRYCWLRDATLTLVALLDAGYVEEARAWRAWLLRAVAGDPADIQVMYTVVGERRLTELELPWLPGYEGSRPVRIGNAASEQLQLDVYGELMDALFQTRARGLQTDEDAWWLQRRLLDFLENIWREPDRGIWEIRGEPRHFTHSKVMAWVAFDRAIRSVEEHGLEGSAERWRRTRDEIHAEVCSRAYDAELGSFTQSYGSRMLDASLLLIPAVGFLPGDDKRVRGTVAAIERELARDGLVLRYPTEEAPSVDGLPAGEGFFLPCSFWLAEALAHVGRHDDARAVVERVLALRNDLGLFSEEYDPSTARLLGNYPQALTHLAFVSAAYSLAGWAPRS
jgi:GH15 family glucan-1,4-alpha-glucosidase